jgi:rare lipoprotein A
MLLLALATILAGCASGPGKSGTSWGPSWGRDGPEANPPPDLDKVPDAEPRVEAILPGGPNKPYSVLGHSYVPLTQDQPYTERGLASWYGKKFQGKRTSSGEVYNMYAMTAAHPTLPIPSYARVRNPNNGREVIVRINDRGPFHSERIVDLSYTAALKLDLLRGVAPVELTRLTFDDIRTGAWKRDALDPGAVRVASATDVQPVGAIVVGSAAGGAVSTDGPAVAPVVDVPPPVAAPPAAPADPAPPPPATSSDAAAGAAAVADAPRARAYTSNARGYWVQLGAFRVRTGAIDFQKRIETDMATLAPLLAIFADASLYRLQAGPYPSRDDARSAAEQIRDRLQLVPVIVERR